MVVVRSMQLTQKKTTATFKQLDGVIRATKPDGSKTSYTHKCGELDKTVPMMIGVSRAVLESVIFCHQEDSSWPLQEGAVLKKRFDDIFDSARYTKARRSVVNDLERAAVAAMASARRHVSATPSTRPRESPRSAREICRDGVVPRRPSTCSTSRRKV